MKTSSDSPFLGVFFQILDCSREEHLWHLQTLLFLRDTVRVDNLIGVTKSKQISPAPCDWSLELARRVMPDFLSHNWCVPFGLLLNSPRGSLLLEIGSNNVQPTFAQSWDLMT
jgi:hypothetical protein